MATVDQSVGQGQTLDTAAAEAPYPSTRYSWYVVFVLMLAYTISFVDRQILSLMVGPIRADLNLSDTEVSLLHGLAFALFYTFMGIFLGWLADRWHRRNLISLGMSVWGLATAGCGLAGSFGSLFAARTMVGVGEAALSPAAYSMISDYFPRSRRGRAIGLYTMGIFIGAGVAYIVGGGAVTLAGDLVDWLAARDIHFRPWQIVFVIVALPAVLLLALMPTVKEPVRREKASAEDALHSITAGVKYISSRASIYGPVILGLAFTSVVTYGFFAWTPSYFIRVFAWTPAEIGVAFGLILLVFGTSGMFLGGILSDRLTAQGKTEGPLTVMMAGTFIASIPAVAMTLYGTPAAALGCLAVFIFFISFHTSLGPLFLQSITPNELRGQVVAVYLFVLNLIGLGLGPSAVAMTSDFIFKNENMIGEALGAVTAVVVPIALGLYWLARRNHMRSQ